MNQVSNEQKDQVLKTLAIVGFIAVIIFGVWLAVQIVSLMPSAFSSLASIADSVYNYDGRKTELVVESDSADVSSGEAFQISWNKTNTDGVYTFYYGCTDGVSVEVTTETGKTLAPCGEAVVLGDSLTTTMVAIASEKDRGVQVQYTIAFIPSGESDGHTFDSQVVTIVNPNIPEESDLALEDDAEADDVAEKDDSDTGEPTVAGESTSGGQTNTGYQTGGVRYVETTTYSTPVSDPNGRVDLAVRLTGVGHLTSAGDFVARANIDEDARGAFQFEVRNIGTKTSDEWDFVADLTGGSEYNAPSQQPLKPQERVVFTLGYDNVGEDGIREIGVRVRGGDDTNNSNNRFTWAVSVVE